MYMLDFGPSLLVEYGVLESPNPVLESQNNTDSFENYSSNLIATREDFEA